MPNYVLNTTSTPGTAAWTDISSLIPSGTQSLAQTLVVGNVTGGKDIVVSLTDVITGPSAPAGSGNPGGKLELAGGASDDPGVVASITLTVASTPAVASLGFYIYTDPFEWNQVSPPNLVPTAGPRTPGGDNYNNTGSAVATAADIAAAINDPANSYAALGLSAVASGNQIIVQGSAPGSAFNFNQCDSSDPSILPFGFNNFSGGANPQPAGPLVLSSPWGSVLSTSSGDARGLYAIDLQSFRASTDEVASGYFSTIIGGSNNKASDTMSSVLSCIGVVNESFATGFYNAQTSSADTATAQSTVIGGNGTALTASLYATVLNGSNVTMSNSTFCLSMSSANVLSNCYNTVVLGADGSATGAFGSIITHGAFNQNNATYSRVGGTSGFARNYAEDVYGVTGFNGVTGSAQRVEAIWAGTRSAAGAATLKLGNTSGPGARYQIPTGFTLNFEWQIVGRCTAGAQAGAVCGFRINGTATNNAGTVTVVATTVVTDSNTFSPAIAAPTAVVDTTDAIAPSVTGIASNTIRYVVVMTGVLVGA